MEERNVDGFEDVADEKTGGFVVRENVSWFLSLHLVTRVIDGLLILCFVEEEGRNVDGFEDVVDEKTEGFEDVGFFSWFVRMPMDDSHRSVHQLALLRAQVERLSKMHSAKFAEKNRYRPISARRKVDVQERRKNRAKDAKFINRRLLFRVKPALGLVPLDEGPWKSTPGYLEMRKRESPRERSRAYLPPRIYRVSAASAGYFMPCVPTFRRLASRRYGACLYPATRWLIHARITRDALPLTSWALVEEERDLGAWLSEAQVESFGWILGGWMIDEGSLFFTIQEPSFTPPQHFLHSSRSQLQLKSPREPLRKVQFEGDTLYSRTTERFAVVRHYWRMIGYVGVNVICEDIAACQESNGPQKRRENRITLAENSRRVVNRTRFSMSTTKRRHENKDEEETKRAHIEKTRRSEDLKFARGRIDAVANARLARGFQRGVESNDHYCGQPRRELWSPAACPCLAHSLHRVLILITSPMVLTGPVFFTGPMCAQQVGVNGGKQKPADAQIESSSGF
ncbi:hypothetical protein KM043_003568 [Ampulex compressa]|nr:hypothetical protein KM043_003568 [Ampulex compressa]